MDEKKNSVPERRGKSWKREREERGRRQNEIKKKDTAVSSKVEERTKVEEKPPTPEMNGDVKEDKVTAEEEEKAEEERKAEEEKQRKKLEEEQMKKAEEKKLLLDYVADAEERLNSKKEVRDANRNAVNNRPDEAFFSRLDSNLKKNTAYVKKLRNLTETSKDALLRDMMSLNLSKYMSEVTAGIVEAKLKMTDIPTAVAVCSSLHQRYAEFSPLLLELWQKTLSFKKDEKVSNPSKLRVELRFYAELISAGVFTHKEGLPLLGNLLTLLVHSDKEYHVNIPILLSFCKHCGEDYAGLIPRKIRELSEEYKVDIPKSKLLTPDRQKNVRTLLKDYFASLCKHLMKDCKELRSWEKASRRILRTKGELSEERQEKQESMTVSFNKLLVSTQQFAEILDEAMPVLPEDDEAKEDEELLNGMKQGDGDGLVEGAEGSLLWEDDDTRSFYESLPDLKAFVPSILYRDSAQATPQKAENKSIDIEEELETMEEEEQLEEEPEATTNPPPAEEETEEPEASTGSSGTKLLLDAFLTSLSNCVSREKIDACAVQFCMTLNTRPNRRKLVKTLFSVPRTRLDLLPFYARLVATLHPCMPDVASDLAHMLRQDFRYHVRKKDQINIESKIKVVRFIGEMVKFKMFQKAEVLHCLKLLLSDFTHHHIEMACNLLETCGRFLFHSRDCHHLTRIFLEQMMRNKSAKALDSRYITMIENSYYHVNPPDTVPGYVKKERPPLHEYIRKLLYKDLAKNNIEKILRQMRKLNWDDPQIYVYAVKCLTSVWNAKYYNVRCVANLLAGLNSYQEEVGLHVVDGVLEDIRLGLEVNQPKYNQRRVSFIKYLGELYNYRMVETSVVFRVLYSLLTFGQNPDGSPAPLDPPENLFRLRLVCCLLDTCGHYFDSGSAKRRLDCFFVYFQRYYLWKRSHEIWNPDNKFPFTVDYLVKDTLHNLRPKLKLCETLEEAQKAVDDLEAEVRPKIKDLLPKQKVQQEGGDEEEDSQQQEDEAGLETIQETEEGDAEDFEDGEGELEEWGLEPSRDESQSQNELPSLSHGDMPGAQCEDLSGEDNEVDDDGSLDMDGDALVSGGPKHIACAEDEDFMSAFDNILAESMNSRVAFKPQTCDISVPFHIRSSTKKTYEQLQEPEQKSDTVTFVLMTRKSNKQQYKNLHVPVDSELALNLRHREEVERQEKERIKKMTLDINERQEEEDYQEMLMQAQRPATVSLNRERKQKYQHPKGAPDADLIFGPKRVKIKS